MKTIETIYGEAVSTEGKIFVWYTDKFSSGHKHVMICKDVEIATGLYTDLRRDRSRGALYVGIGKELPKFRNCSVTYQFALHPLE